MQENLPLYLFHQGTNYKAYDFMGAHFCEQDGKKGVVFRTWAPKALSVSVIGDFNNWNEKANKMTKISDGGVWETFIEGAKEYDSYKFCVKSRKGIVQKADPYAFHSETSPKTASKVYDLEGFKWTDSQFNRNNRGTPVYSHPINVYEVNLASWKKNPDGSYYSFRQLAKELVYYVKSMNYTHVEIMPIAEYPYDASWGYQVTGYYSICSRFGTPKDFMYLVNEFHKKDIGVILDWVPAHFPKDSHGLIEFDGYPCYEYKDKQKQEHKGWGTRVFDWGRNEVQSFLVSNANFLFDKFHIDGLRVDAVSSMLYLDYDRKAGEWSPNSQGTNYNLEAIAFFKKLNEVVFGEFPYALMIAEESTAFPLVTKPVYLGGLGFNFKWNMGWMHDSLDYIRQDPIFRCGAHNKITFSLVYAFSENFILPISHDEVVYGKKSLIDKMPGDYGDKFANMRAYLAYMMAHPGKKLMFMGQEFAQFKEWNHDEGLEFFMLDYDKHKKMQSFVKDINLLYKVTSPLYEIEDSWLGFSWVAVDEKERNLLAFKRVDKEGNVVLVLVNFSGCDYKDYYLKTERGRYLLIMNTDAQKFGGEGKLTKRVFEAKRYLRKDTDTYIKVDVPRLSCLYFEKFKG